MLYGVSEDTELNHAIVSRSSNSDVEGGGDWSRMQLVKASHYVTSLAIIITSPLIAVHDAFLTTHRAQRSLAVIIGVQGEL